MSKFQLAAKVIEVLSDNKFRLSILDNAQTKLDATKAEEVGDISVKDRVMVEVTREDLSDGVITEVFKMQEEDTLTPNVNTIRSRGEYET